MFKENTINQIFIRGSLIPVIIQEKTSGDVLMLGYMDKNALINTLKTGFVWFWSRSKNRLWMKGEKSGNRLRIDSILSDCDKDALLIKVILIGKNTCHKGFRSCFQPQNNSFR